MTCLHRRSLILPQGATFTCVITVSYSTANSFCPILPLNTQKCNKFSTCQQIVPNYTPFYVFAPCQSAVLNFSTASLMLSITTSSTKSSLSLLSSPPAFQNRLQSLTKFSPLLPTPVSQTHADVLSLQISTWSRI